MSTMKTRITDILEKNHNKSNYVCLQDAIDQVEDLNLTYDKWLSRERVKNKRAVLMMSSLIYDSYVDAQNTLDSYFKIRSSLKILFDYLLAKFAFVNDLKLNENTIFRFKHEWLGVKDGI